MGRMGLILLAYLALSACATRGSLDVHCDGFTEAPPGKIALRHPLPLSPIERQIRGQEGLLTPLGAGQTESGLLTRTLYAYQQAVFRQKLHAADPLKDNPALGDPAVLLLSGGGQWGAFGAGFLSRLAEKGEVPNFFVITGVSTGSMQAMFVGSDHPDKWQWLKAAYTIDKEHRIVRRNAKWRALFTGSFAGLGPLYHRIETALCPPHKPGVDQPDCPAISALAKADRQILVGYIEARSGDFYYSDIHQIATRTSADNARACIAGTALASSAMPVTFQQVRINGRAYYDGGVRQSVFANWAEQLGRAVRAYETKRPAESINDMPFYVIRNGPTALSEDNGEADKSPDAFTAAQRAQAIVTNQLEVGSIAGLRLQKPGGPIRFVTADGWDEHLFMLKGKSTSCKMLYDAAKKKGRMFDPDFMACLMDYGRARADKPWSDLMSISADRKESLPPITKEILPPPANDNEPSPQ